jgi:hypothetical protein
MGKSSMTLSCYKWWSASNFIGQTLTDLFV